MLDDMAREPNQSDDLFVPVDALARPLPPDIKLPPSEFFPSPTATTTEGLLCVGGRLASEWLLDAYRHGIFPWPMWDDDPIAWWSPDPRAIFELDRLHVSRRLERTIRSGKFRVTCDHDFEGVIRGCATAGDRVGSTWLTPSMIEAYCRMHELGHAHSVEVWLADELVGGTYGLAIGGLFAAESMFHYARDASKVALVNLVIHLRARGYRLFDIQQLTPHTARFGAIEILRVEYLRRLAKAVAAPVTFGESLAELA
jgi:leucyl/phenylalanyl-tRNA---protein transferase